MFEGQILWTKSLQALEQQGASIQKLIDAGYEDSAVAKDQPMVVSCWSSMIRLPGLEESRALPILAVALPTPLAKDLHALATSPLELEVIEAQTWPYRTTLLELVGSKNTIRFRGDELLPALRVTPIGSVVMLLVCGDEVLLVEYPFDRKTFLKMCHRMHLDYVVNDAEDPGIYLSRGSSVIEQNDRKIFLPTMNVLDADEEFFYGVLRSSGTAST